jgi:hypothetical protein
MRLRIVRTVTRPSTSPDPSAKKPWLNVLAHSQRAREAVMAIEAAVLPLMPKGKLASLTPNY